MAKGMCIIQSNKTKKCTAKLFIQCYLVRVGSCLPGYVNSLSLLFLEVCVGVGVQSSVACDQTFVRDPPPCVIYFRGVSLGPLQHIPPCVGLLTSGRIHHRTQRAKRRGMQPKFCQVLPPTVRMKTLTIFSGVLHLLHHLRAISLIFQEFKIQSLVFKLLKDEQKII